MSKPTAKTRPKSLLDASIMGRELTPQAKAFIKALAARAAHADSRRRAILGKPGPSPIGVALVAAGLAPAASVAGGPDAQRSASREGAPRRPAHLARRPPLGAAVGEFVDRKTETVSDNLGYYRNRIAAWIDDGQARLDAAPQVVRDNLHYYMPGLDDYLDMVGKTDMSDAGWLTPDQVELRRRAKLERERPDYNTPYFQAIRRRREALHPVAREIDAGGRSFADTATWGGANYLAAGMDTMANPYSFSQNLEGERYIDLLDSRDARSGQIAGRLAGSFVQPGGSYVAAAKTLPSAMARAGAAEGANSFVHEVIATPGDLEDRLEGGAQGALSDALFAPIGPLAGHGVVEVAPLAAREYPFIKDVLSGLATTAPKELADAMADAERRRAGLR